MVNRWVKQFRFTAIVTCVLLWFLGICDVTDGLGNIWSDAKIRALPDASFAAVEVRDDGTRIRHCPYRDLNGNIDGEQLIYSLGTFSEEKWLDPKQKEIARSQLEAHYQKLLSEWLKEGLKDPVDINTAPLTRLVTLPRIGPVLAVRILKHREAHGKFLTIEDITKVDGIGRGTLNAIRHYIRAS
ncbi:MAG: ComEA family DNA-binding protein [Thermodesulfobacteriota bacterium]